MGADEASAHRQRAACHPHYDVRAVPLSATGSGSEERSLLRGAAAILMCWTPHAAGALQGLRALGQPLPGPIIALCEAGRPAERVTALMTGADFVAEPPLLLSLLQAMQVAHRRNQISGKRPLLQRTMRDLAWAAEAALLGARSGDGAGESSEAYPEPSIKVRAPTPAAQAEKKQAETTKQSKTGAPRPSEPADATTEVGPLTLEVPAGRIWIDGISLQIRPRPFSLIAYLADRAGQCCTRDDILAHVWGMEFDPSTNVVDVQVYALRRILKPYGLDHLIETVRGRGYRLLRSA